MSRQARLWIGCWLLGWLLPSALLAQQASAPRRRLDLVVSASTDRAVFVDEGSAVGIAIGDRARFFPTSAAPVEAVVRAVTAHHARIELLGEASSLAVGTRGEVWVSTEPDSTADDEPASETVVESSEAGAEVPAESDARESELPWRSPPEDWDASMPLLSPPASSPLSERETRMRARVWAATRWSRAQLHGARESAYLRSGISWTLENPFARGGELRFDGELYTRLSEVSGERRQDESDLRLSRFSYQLGGQRDSSRRWLLGRFYQQVMPEFGPLDGVEFSQRLGTEDEIGVSVGHMPPPNAEVASSEDYQVGLFHQHRSTSSVPVDWRVGYQRTWHGSQRDRDLVVLDGRVRNERHDFLSATAWVDYYESDEVAKPEALELTRLYVATGRSTPEGDGLRLYYSEFRFPLLLRQEFDPVLDTTLFEEHNTRAGIDLWTTFESGPRLRTRLDRWSDEEEGGEEGLAAEVACDIPRALPGDAELGVALFGSRGEFSHTAGLRVSALGYEAGSFWNVAWELQVVEEQSANTPTPAEWQNLLLGGFDTQVFEDFTLALDLVAGWGDQGESLGLGVLLQRSF